MTPIIFDPALFTDAINAARALRDMGLRPVFVQVGGKNALMKDWLNAKPDEVIAKFDASPDANVGVLLGYDRGLLDIDLDSGMSRIIVPRLMGRFVPEPLPSYGRSGKPVGHLFIAAEDEANPGDTVKFGLSEKEAEALGIKPSENGKRKRMILEIRSKGQQSVIPPSRLDGGDAVDRVEWTLGGAVPRAPREVIDRIAALGAFLSVIAFKYPRTDGDRNEVYLSLIGALCSCEWLTDEDVDWCADLVAGIAKDESRKGRAADTREKFKAGEPVWALPRLLELLGIEPLGKTLRKWLGIASPERGALNAVPSGAIYYAPGRLADIIVETEEALVRAGEPIYQRGSFLSRVARLESEGSLNGVRRVAGSCVLLPVDALYMTERLARVAQVVTKSRKGNIVRTDPRPIYSAHVLKRAGDWSFHPLRGIVNHPTLRPDLSLLDKPGYDEASRTIFDPCGVEFPPIPAEPTRDEAFAAIRLFDPLLCGFPFVSVDDRAVALSAILTGIIRRAFPAAPIHGFDATAPGTGKSLLAETCGIIIIGRKPPAMTMGRTAEEFEKRLASSGLAGDEVILIDNVDAPLESEFLCSYTTQEFIQTRILGASTNKTLPAGGLVLVTGNNLVYAGDVPRRVVSCRMDARMERPDQRQFNFDPRDLARRDRGALVAAGLTIVRAYVSAGCPAPLPKLGSFEDWNVVREALAWLDAGDCAATRARIFDLDPNRNELAELLTVWHAAAGSEPLTLSDIRARAEHSDTVVAYQPVYQALIELSGRPTFNARAIGKRLLLKRERIVSGLVLVKGGEDRKGIAQWRVLKADGSDRAVYGSARGCSDEKGGDHASPF